MDRQSISNDVLLDFALNRLSAVEAQSVQQQISAEPELKRRVEELRRLGKLLRDNYQPVPVARPDARDAAMAGIIAEFVEAARSGTAPMVEISEHDVLSAMSPSPEAETARAQPSLSANLSVALHGRSAMPTPTHQRRVAATSVTATDVVGGRRWTHVWRYAAAAAVIASVAVWSFIDDGKSTWSNRPNSTWPAPSSTAGTNTAGLPATNTSVGQPSRNSGTPAPKAAGNANGNSAVVMNAPKPVPSNVPSTQQNGPEANPLNRDAVVQGSANANANGNANANQAPAATSNANTPDGMVAAPTNAPTPAANSNSAAASNAGTPEATVNRNVARPQGQDTQTVAAPAEAVLQDRIRQAFSSAAFMAVAGGGTAPAAPASTSRDFVVQAQRLRGDIDDNGTVNVLDANLLLKQLLKTNAKPALSSATDVNGDGKVDIRDYMRLLNDTRAKD